MRATDSLSQVTLLNLVQLKHLKPLHALSRRTSIQCFSFCKSRIHFCTIFDIIRVAFLILETETSIKLKNITILLKAKAASCISGISTTDSRPFRSLFHHLQYKSSYCAMESQEICRKGKLLLSTIIPLQRNKYLCHFI